MENDATPDSSLRREFQQLATGVRAVTVMFSLVVAIYNALVTLQLHRAADSLYGGMIIGANKAPWVLLHPWWLSVSSAVLPVAAGVLGLRLRNHLHALTAVMICLILMIAQMHAVSAALLEPVMQLLDGVRNLTPP